MNGAPKTIYRRPEHAGTKPVIRAGSPMRTFDPKRLAHAGTLQSIPVRRRALSKRAVILSFLLCVLVVIAALAIATSEGRATHAQTTIEPWCEIGSAPALPATTCLTARVYLPEVSR